MQIGPFKLANPVIAAPMAGVTDKPYRKICRQFGAAMAVSEMLTSKLELRQTTKSRFRMDLAGEPEPIAVQIVGTDPQRLAEAARYNVANGAQIVDINMGCPAKKVCKKAAGSALLANEPLVADILSTVVEAVDVPVTVKIRTGTTLAERNAVSIAKISQDAGVQAITVHGRTRQCKFVGAVEYDTIAAVKAAVSIPVIANGDICTPEQAQNVLRQTAADAIMVGRAAQGQPWLFKQIADYLAIGDLSSTPTRHHRATTIMSHIRAIHQFYGVPLGLKLARKHIKWYLQHWDTAIDIKLRNKISITEHPQQQLDLLEQFLISGFAPMANAA
jgi:tRNA-dihydrouridine synthase B